MNSSETDIDQIRVALVITELNVGGAERCLVNLATGLDRTRFAPQVYSLGPPPTAGQSLLVQQLAAADVPTHFLGAESIRQVRAAIRGLRRHLCEQSPHLIQTFLFHANVLGCWAARHRQLASALVVGGIRVADPRKGRMWLERLALRRAAKVICVSDSVANFAVEKVGLPRPRLAVVPNGLQTTLYESPAACDLAEVGIAPEQQVILFVGRLDPQKGVDWLLQTAGRFLCDLPQHHLLLVGDGNQRAALTRLAEKSPARHQIHFAGWRADIPSLLARCQMLVLPSRWEGMPNAVLEAMAAGRPVVAARADGVEQLLGEGAREQVVDFGDDTQLIQAIRSLADQPQLAHRLGRQNLDRAKRQFSLRHMVHQYESIYAALLKQKPRD